MMDVMGGVYGNMEKSPVIFRCESFYGQLFVEFSFAEYMETAYFTDIVCHDIDWRDYLRDEKMLHRILARCGDFICYLLCFYGHLLILLDV